MKNLLIILLILGAFAFWLTKRRKSDPENLVGYSPFIDEIEIQSIDIKDIIEWFIHNKKGNNNNTVGIVLDLTKAEEINDLIKSNVIYSVLMKQVKINSNVRLLLCYYNKSQTIIIDEMPMAVMYGGSLSDELISQFGEKPLIIIE